MASGLGLDMKKFTRDFKDPQLEKIIKDDMNLADTFGVRGTPIFFINGRELRGAQPLSSFKSLIEELLPRVKAVGGSGDPLYDRLVACGLTERKIKRSKPKPMQAENNPSRIYSIPADNSYWIGGRNAKVEIIVFSDFQCPYCARHSQTMKKILDTYGTDVRIVFKNLPLSFHKNSMPAAEAAMAAGAQGKFWQMYDILFENRKNLSRRDLESYAKELGLDMRRFKEDMDSHAYSSSIKKDLETAKEFGINGTPTTFVNGKKISGARATEDFEKIIDRALGK